jgi:PIN domain nuclease of toxin-antitoxin system
MMPVSCVLDASALLAAMLGEPGAEDVEQRLGDSCVSAVNLSEVVAKLSERGVPADVIAESLADLDLDVRAFDVRQANRAGLLRPMTRRVGLSLGDRACLALAAELECTAITTDKAWMKLDIGIAIELAR